MWLKLVFIFIHKTGTVSSTHDYGYRNQFQCKFRGFFFLLFLQLILSLECTLENFFCKKWLKLNIKMYINCDKQQCTACLRQLMIKMSPATLLVHVQVDRRVFEIIDWGLRMITDEKNQEPPHPSSRNICKRHVISTIIHQPTCRCNQVIKGKLSLNPRNV